MENLDYKQCLRILSETIAVIFQPTQMDDDLEDALSPFANLNLRILPHLQTQDHCRSIQNRIEYFAFRIQSSFVATSLSLRQAQHNNRQTDQERATTIGSCRASCSHTLEAFLDMQTFTVIPLRTWTFLHNALASALFLGVLDSKNDASVKALQSSLLAILMRSEEEGATPQNFRKCFGRALDGLKRMVPGSHQSEQEGAQDGEVDTEM
jgi:hypothetical protein